MTLPARITDKISAEAPGGCWLWIAYLSDDGYGRIRWNGRQPMAHRVVYELLVGPVSTELQLDHLCRVRNCVNPDHLEPVTAVENVRRSTSAAYWRAKTHCPRNHPYDDANTGTTKRGGRICRACARERMRERRAAAKPPIRRAA